MDNDRTIIEKVINGDNNAFETFVKRYQKLVGHIVFRLISGSGDREDICQDVFVKVYRGLDGFHHESKVSTWIGKITYNTCLNFLAKKKETVFSDIDTNREDDNGYIESVSAIEKTGGSVERKELFAILQKEIFGLPLPYRTVVTLYHLEEMTYMEIAKIMDLPINTVKSHLFRARKKLRDNLKAKYTQEDLCPRDI